MRVLNSPSAIGREVEKHFARYLDDRFTLAHQVRLRGSKTPIDAVLVGPHGVMLFAFSDDQVRVRCLGDNWYIWNPKVKNLVKAERNPVKQLQGDLAAMQAFLEGRQLGSLVPLEGAVLVPRPEVQVEFMDNAIPVLSANGIKELAAALPGQAEMIEWKQADDVLSGLGLAPLGKPWSQLLKTGPRARVTRSRRGGLQRWQIIFLAAMAVADLLVLIGGLAVVLLIR
jgi:hypothetical protein